MAVRQIVTYNDPLLREMSIEISALDDATTSAIADLKDTLRVSLGVGLAAPQIGVSKRLIIVDPRSVIPGAELLTMINPKIMTSQGRSIFEEGCLSLPGIFTDVKRPDSITTEFINGEGELIKKGFSGIYARIIQHEVDHLNGILFLDHVSRIKRWYFYSKLNRLQHAY